MLRSHAGQFWFGLCVLFKRTADPAQDRGPVKITPHQTWKGFMQIASIRLVSWPCNGKAGGVHSSNGQGYPHFINPDTLKQNNFERIERLLTPQELVFYMKRYGLGEKPPKTAASLVNGLFDAFCHPDRLVDAGIPKNQIPGRRLQALLDLKRLLIEKGVNVEEIICSRNAKETAAIWDVIDNGLQGILTDKAAPQCLAKLGLQPAQVAQFASEYLHPWFTETVYKAKPGPWRDYLQAIKTHIVSFTNASPLYWHCPFSSMLIPQSYQLAPVSKPKARI